MSAVPSGDKAGRIGLAICTSHPDTVYAFVDHQSEDEDWADADEYVPSGRLTARRFMLLDDDKILEIDKVKLQTFLRIYDRDIKVDDILKQIKDKKLTVEQLRERLKEKSPNAFGQETGAELYRNRRRRKIMAPNRARSVRSVRRILLGKGLGEPDRTERRVRYGSASAPIPRRWEELDLRFFSRPRRLPRGLERSEGSEEGLGRQRRRAVSFLRRRRDDPPFEQPGGRTEHDVGGRQQDSLQRLHRPSR